MSSVVKDIVVNEKFKGLTEKDVERVLNGEISVEELFNEIEDLTV